MSRKKAPGQDDKPQRSVLELVREIKERRLSGKSLTPEDRRRCVEYLIAESLPVPEIAEMMDVDDRTIQRDKREIRHANALTRDPALCGEMAGFLWMQAEVAISAFSRAIRDRQTPAAVRVDAIKARFEVAARLGQCLQSLGFLPTATSQVRAEVTHRYEEPPDLAALTLEITELEVLVKQTGDQNPEACRAVDDLRSELARMQLVDRIEETKTALIAPQDNGVTPHEPVRANPESA